MTNYNLTSITDISGINCCRHVVYNGVQNVALQAAVGAGLDYPAVDKTVIRHGNECY